MKTPEEIKVGLECCSVEYRCPTDCRPCPYVARKPFCESEMHRDAFAYIKQLEAQVPKWISEDTPPQKEGEYIVIVRTADGKEERMWDIFHPNHGWCEDDEGNKVLYWMSFDSLHKPPKEDAHGI